MTDASARPRDTGSVVAWSLWGEAAGLAIAILTVAAERSGIAFGPYSLAGNGALAVPGILVPVALYAGWTALLRGRSAIGAQVSFVVGLAVGVGLAALFAAALGGTPIGWEVVPAVLATGALFTLPPALLAALPIYAFGPGRLRADALTLSAAVAAVMLVSALPPLAQYGGLGANGLLAGILTVAGVQARSASALVVLGAALLALLLVLTFAVPLLVIA
ncbi:MAG: hypothetical protein ACRDGE_00175 [Candidatus Limnocylindria bacterium]